MLSAAKHLSAHRARPFAALRVTRNGHPMERPKCIIDLYGWSGLFVHLQNRLHGGSDLAQREGEFLDNYTDGMTLEEQIGQVLMVGFLGNTPSQEIIDLIQRYHVGNILLFSRNVRDARQVYELTQS